MCTLHSHVLPRRPVESTCRVELDVPPKNKQAREALMRLITGLEYVWISGAGELEYLKVKYQKRKEKHYACAHSEIELK